GGGHPPGLQLGERGHADPPPSEAAGGLVLRRHGVLRDRVRRCGLLGRLDDLCRQPADRRWQQRSWAAHRQCAATLHRPDAVSMKRLLRNLLGIVPTLLLSWTIVFGAMHLIPGDPVAMMLAGTPATDQVVEAARARLGLDRTIGEQYLAFVERVVVGDF